MRVLQVLPSISSTSGGPPRSTVANCRALHAADPDVETVLLTTDEALDEDWRGDLASRCPARMEVQVVPGHGRHTTLFSPSLLRWMWQHVGGYDLVVIRALLHPVSSSAARVASARGVPYLLVPHGTLSRYTFRHRRTLLKRLYYRLVDAATVDRASALRFTTRAERDEARRLGFETPSAVIPHPFEPRFDEEASSPRSSRQLLFLARFDPKKGISLLLEAVDRVRREVTGIKVVLAGSGMPAFETELRSLIRRLDLQDVVELPGFVRGEAKRRLLLRSTAFALPSEHENFGVSVVEAMDAGLPVVISRGVQIWPDVTDAGAGIVLEERTPECLAGALGEVLTNHGRRREMGRNGRQLVRSVYDPLMVGRRLSHLYRAAAEGPARVRETIS